MSDSGHSNLRDLGGKVTGGRNELSTLRLSGENAGELAASPSKQKERKAVMFARHVTMQLKPNMEKEFPVAFEKEILPLLRKQKGFLDELLLLTPEKREVVAISLWDTKEYAEAYNRELYPQIEKIVARFAEGFPIVKKYEAEYSTFHKIAFAAVA
jgi:heme-degrading monooxygenase HmoA